jgi:hypothetical protein
MSGGKGRGSRPALTDVDLSDMPAPILQPDPLEVERRRTFASSLENPAFLEHSTSAGLVKVVRHANFPGASISDAREVSAQNVRSAEGSHELAQPVDQSRPKEIVPRRLRAEEPNLTVRLPEYVQQAVRLRAVREKTTLRLVILRALRGAGFEIRDEDMTDDRGIVAKTRSRGR